MYLPEIEQNGLPKDVWQNDAVVYHHYPNPKYIHQYLSMLKKILQKITGYTDCSGNILLSSIALYYQYAINTHLFENINQSLFANQMNALLQLFGYNPIEHGILDFVAMRLQPENFVTYFIDEVKRVNINS